MKNSIRMVILTLLAGWLLFNLFQTVQWVIADYPQIPVADYWREPQYWPQAKIFHWAHVLVQHNEHRIFFPELTYIADMFFFHGRMYLPIALSGLCYLSIWFVLLWAAYSQNVFDGPLRDIALLLAGIVIVWKGCSSVIATPFQLAFTMTQIAVAMALALLVKTAETGRPKFLAATIVAAVVATYSVGNGMLVWPVLVVGALILKVSRRQILTLAVAAMVSVGVYFIGYHPLPSLISTNVKHPLMGIQFLCSYFSMPFGYFKVPSYGVKTGAAALLLMSACFAYGWNRGLLTSRLALVLFGSYLFNLVSAVLTTLGRMDMNDPTFQAAKVSRYVTMPTVSWALLIIAVVWMLGKATSARWACLAAVLAGYFFGSGFAAANRWLEFSRLDAQNAQVTATMLRDNVFYPDQIRSIFPDPEFVRVNLSTMYNDRKFIWAHGPDTWIGGDLRTLPLSTAPIAGKVTRVYPVAGGLEIFGWADSATLTDDHAVLFVDPATGRIAGFGGRPAAGMPADLNTWDTPNQLTFVGFVALDRPVEKLSVYVRTFHGKLVQPMDGTIEIPSYTALAERTDKPALPDIQWQQDANWTAQGYQPGPFNGPVPSGPIYGSWSGSDAKTGAIRSDPFAVPADHCIVLPVLHGTATYGQSVEVRDGETNKILAELPMMDGRSIWERWRIKIADASRTIKVTAQDEGTGPNQWLAISTPEQCP